MKPGVRSYWVILIVFLTVEIAKAVPFESLPAALTKVLNGETKVVKRNVKVKGKSADAFIPKKRGKKGYTIAFVQKEVYPPNCTHTWVIGVQSRTRKVTSIREVEMSCPHAFPTRKNSFKSQFVGKGPADVRKLKKGIDYIAKATGSSELLRDSVVRSIEGAKKIQ